MNFQRVVAAAGLALALMGGAAHATTFDYTGGFQTFTAPTAGIYDITSAGAQGGGAYGTSALGGLGAKVGGDFMLTSGEALTILVGGMGGFGGQSTDFYAGPPGGGGGGSFVYTPIVGTFGLVAPPAVGPANTFTGYVQLADAGGGGGLGTQAQGYPAGGDGQAYGGGPFPGASGQGATEEGGSGAGYLIPGYESSEGGGNSPGFGGQGGVAVYYAALYPANADGHGGFGGGGAGGGSQGGGFGNEIGGGGGGGGCSGGTGGDTTGGSGGYSCLADGTPMNADYVRLSGVQAGNGLVTINFVSAVSAAPEPSTWLLMFAGIGGIGLMLRRKKREGGSLAGAAAI